MLYRFGISFLKENGYFVTVSGSINNKMADLLKEQGFVAFVAGSVGNNQVELIVEW